MAQENVFTPEPNRRLTTQTEIEVYLHRTRLAMMRRLCVAPATVSDLGRAMGVHPANLSRHMRVLEQAGLIRLIEHRHTGRGVAKIYRAVARAFDVAPDMAAVTAPHKIALNMARSDLSAALAHLPDDAGGPVFVKLTRADVPAGRLAEYTRALDELNTRFTAETGGDPFHMLVAVYPGDPRAADSGTEVKFHK